MPDEDPTFGREIAEKCPTSVTRGIIGQTIVCILFQTVAVTVKIIAKRK